MIARTAVPLSTAGAALVVLALPLSLLAHGIATLTAVAVGLVWLATGLRRHRPGGSAWVILAAAAATSTVATIAFYWPVLAGGTLPRPQPSLADALWVVSCLLLTVCLVLALTRRERPLMILLDVASNTIGAGLIVGIVLVEPALRRHDVALDLRVSQVVYAVIDVFLFAVVARVLVAPRGRPGVLWLLAGAGLCIIAAGAFTNPLFGIDDGTPRYWIGIGAGLGPLLLGLAALHPSMARLGVVESRTDGERRAIGPLVLGLTLLVPPLVRSAHTLVTSFPNIEHSRPDNIALIAGSTALAAIVVARFALLIRRARGLADRSEERYQKLVEQVPAVVALFKLGGPAPTPIYVSPQAEAIMGMHPDAWLARPEAYTSRVNQEDMARIRASRVGQPPGPPEVMPEFRMTRPDGREIWLRDVSGVISEEPDGRYLHSMLVDITEAKHAEADRAHMEGELRLAQKLEAVGQLAAGIAHEINTPIQFVGDTIGFLQDAFEGLLELTAAQEHLRLAVEAGGSVDPALLERVHAAEEVADLEYLRERVPGAFQRGADGVARIATIVRAMRDFAHPPTLIKAPVDIIATLEDTLIVASNAYKYVADVTTDFESLPQVMANGGEMNQVFLNLVVNAAHAIESVVGNSGDRGSINLCARRAGDHVRVSISDTGCGIADNVAARVFDPFFTTKEVGRGTGQGLAIARTMVVERHGGLLSFDTEPGSGTTFHVDLPIGVAA